MTPEAREWLALHRVHEGGVTTLGGEYFNAGRPVSGELADTFGVLIGSGLLALGQPDPIGRQQVCVTHIGQARYSELSAWGDRRHEGSER